MDQALVAPHGLSLAARAALAVFGEAVTIRGASAEGTPIAARALTATEGALVPVSSVEGQASAKAPTNAESFPDPTKTGDETIVITGSRRAQPLAETTTATEVISREDIVNSGAESLAGVLANHPGLDVQPALRGSDVRMQGLSSTYVLILVDGERAIGRIGGAIDLQRFPIEEIERVEIVKGPSSALYGSDALAGVINIITRKGTAPLSATLHSSMGQLGKSDLSAELGAMMGAWSSLTSAGWHVGDGYDRDRSNLATTASSFDERHIKQSFKYAASKTLTLRAGGEYLVRDQVGTDESATGAVFDRTSRTETAGLSLGSEWRGAEGRRFAANARYGLWHDQLLRDQRLSEALDSYEATEEQIGELRFQHDRAFAENHYLSAGVEGLAESLEADRITGRGSRYRAALFVQDEWTLDTQPYIVLSPGVRADADTQFGFHVTPKLAARYDVREGLTIRASYGQGFRAPNFRELLLFFENPAVGYRVSGNEDLKPEHSHGANVSAQAKLGDRWWGTLSSFYNDIENLITTDLVSVDGMDGTQVFGYVNVESARTAGVESQLKTSPIAGLTVDVGYTFTSTLDRSTGRALPGRARHQATAKATYQYPDSSLRLHIRGGLYGSRVFFEQDEEVSASPYADISSRITGDIAKYLSVFVGAQNLLNAGDALLLPIAPRTFYGGMTARY
jgi:outer membrane receptor for ferrienterochelin and colicins